MKPESLQQTVERTDLTAPTEFSRRMGNLPIPILNEVGKVGKRLGEMGVLSGGTEYLSHHPTVLERSIRNIEEYTLHYIHTLQSEEAENKDLINGLSIMDTRLERFGSYNYQLGVPTLQSLDGRGEVLLHPELGLDMKSILALSISDLMILSGIIEAISEQEGEKYHAIVGDCPNIKFLTSYLPHPGWLDRFHGEGLLGIYLNMTRFKRKYWASAIITQGQAMFDFLLKDRNRGSQGENNLSTQKSREISSLFGHIAEEQMFSHRETIEDEIPQTIVAYLDSLSDPTHFPRKANYPSSALARRMIYSFHREKTTEALGISADLLTAMVINYLLEEAHRDDLEHLFGVFHSGKDSDEIDIINFRNGAGQDPSLLEQAESLAQINEAKMHILCRGIVKGLEYEFGAYKGFSRQDMVSAIKKHLQEERPEYPEKFLALMLSHLSSAHAKEFVTDLTKGRSVQNRYQPNNFPYILDGYLHDEGPDRGAIIEVKLSLEKGVLIPPTTIRKKDLNQIQRYAEWAKQNNSPIPAETIYMVYIFPLGARVLSIDISNFKPENPNLDECEVEIVSSNDSIMEMRRRFSQQAK